MNYRILCMTTAGTARLACNFVESARRAGVDARVLIYCLDDGSCQTLSEYVVATDSAVEVVRYELERCDPGAPSTANPIDWGTREFVHVALAKLNILSRHSSPALEHFEPWLYCDVDAILWDDPSAELARLFEHTQGGPALWFQSDRQDFATMLDAAQGQYCSGCIFSARPAPGFWQVASKWLLQRAPSVTPVDFGHYVDDQSACNAAISFLPQSAGVLDPWTWINGARRWPAFEICEAERRRVYFIHANWIVGAAAKESRLRAAGLWFVRDDLAGCLLAGES